jgi:hypothetical protein
MATLPKVDLTPAGATAHGFDERIAFVFDTHRPDRADAFFDWALCARLAEEVKSVLECDRIEALDEKGAIRSFRAAGELARYGAGDMADEPLRALTCYRGSDVVAFAEAVPWTRVGGLVALAGCSELITSSFTAVTTMFADRLRRGHQCGYGGSSSKGTWSDSVKRQSRPRPETGQGLRTYPSRSAARQVMIPQAKCSIAM